MRKIVRADVNSSDWFPPDGWRIVMIAACGRSYDTCFVLLEEVPSSDVPCAYAGGPYREVVR